MKEGIRSSLVTGCFVLLGGLVAAGASIGTTLVTQHGEDERIDEEARGAARVLINRFATTISAIDDALYEGSYANLTPWIGSKISAGDLKLITARLSFSGVAAWTDVPNAPSRPMGRSAQ